MTFVYFKNSLNIGRSSLKRFYCNSKLMDLKGVVKILNNYAPLELAESWDNVGLLVEPFTHRPIERILLTNDLTSAVMEEAVAERVELILSYHPPLFRPIKTIVKSHWQEKIISQCLEERIAIYSPHTSYDALLGGVNDWLISAFGDDVSTPLSSSNSLSYSHKIEFLLDNSPEDASFCSSLKCHLNETLGSESSEFEVLKNGLTLVILCNEKCIPLIVSQRTKHLTITKLEKPPMIGYGSGRKMTLSNPITLKEAVEKVKKHLKLPHVRLAIGSGRNIESSVKSVAVCAGSGASLLRNVRTDLLLTGEMSHHEVLNIIQNGSSVILTDHSNSERGFLSEILKPKLADLFENKINIIVSKNDADPLQIV